jgi:hypothetical protein
MRLIERKQIVLIKLAIRGLQIPDSRYREILSDRYWAHSCKDLSYDEASDLIKYFQTMGFKIITKRYTPRRPYREGIKAPNIIQLVSPQQLALIAHLRADITWHVHDGYFRWLKKWLKKDRITTDKEARNVIEALKGMLKRQQAKVKVEAEENLTSTSLRRDGGMHGGHYKW